MKQKVEIMSMTDEILSPITKASNVLLEDGSNVQQLIDNYVEPEFTPTIETSSSMSKVGQGDNVDFSANVINGAYESCVLKGKTLVNYNAEGNDRNEYVCMPSVEGQHITATDTIEGHAKSAILKGNTGYRDIDTGEFLETFEEGRNLELVSVKMPVLKTIGKNLFTGSISVGGLSTTTGEELINKNLLRSEFLDVLKNTTYTNNTNGDYRYFFYDENKIFINSIKGNPFTTPNNCEYIRFHISSSEYTDQLQIEQGSVATSYEPFKSNILTVNEEIELGAVGEVQDTLDLLTGEVIERTDEITLDVTNVRVATGDGSDRFEITSNIIPKNNQYITNDNSGINNWGLTVLNNYNYAKNNTITYHANSKKFFIRFESGLYTAESLKQKLIDTPLTLRYQLEAESIKTVDLSDNHVYSYNDTTHYTCSSEEGSLIPTLSIEEGVKYQAIIKPSTKYSIVFNRTVASDSLTVDLGGATANVVSTTIGKTIVQITTLPTLSHNYVKFLGVGNAIKDVQVIEGEVADDVEYFEGMIDVENPVVTNTGKNLYNGVNSVGFISDSTGIVNPAGVDWLVTDFVKVERNKTYTFSEASIFNGLKKVAIYDSDKNFLTMSNTLSFTPSENGYVRFNAKLTTGGNVADFVNQAQIQLEESSTPTAYEPYKSNTITTEQSDGSIITLRKVGDVCDTLDLMSGEYVQRVGVRAYQEGDESNSQVSTDKVNTQYQLETPITTTIDLKQHPYAYKDGYINLSSNGENSLAPSIEYSLPINRSGQVSINTQLVQKQQKQLDELESMIITNMVNTQYKQTLSNVEYMLGGE